MSYSAVLPLMSEVGLNGIRKFKTAKHFAGLLRPAPKNKVSGGKVLTSKVPKGSNRLEIALRNAADAIGNLIDFILLRDFFPRLNFRKGRVSAISTASRKLEIGKLKEYPTLTGKLTYFWIRKESWDMLQG